MRDWTVVTAAAEQTEQLGALLGSLLPAGMTVWLAGDLGSGKTCLARGLAHGLGVPADEPVTSPTFTLVNEYAGRLPLRHLDLYRLGSAAELEEIGFRETLSEDGVTVVEWAERANAATAQGLHVALALGAVDGERRLAFHAAGGAAERVLATLSQRWPARVETP